MDVESAEDAETAAGAATATTAAAHARTNHNLPPPDAMV